MPLTLVNDFTAGSGWNDPAQAETRARQCCEGLESGEVLCFPTLPYRFSPEDQQFLLAQKLSDGSAKNITYRPEQDQLRGAESDQPENAKRLQDLMRRYSQEVTGFLSQILAPYAPHWSLYYATYRPEQEKGRNLPTLKRNDLLHIDVFSSRPTRGGRILRCFTNINPSEPRVWISTDRFPALAARYAREAGLDAIANAPLPKDSLVKTLKRAVGIKKAPPTSAYDQFMLRFHDFMKENSDFQENCVKDRLELPPGSTWLCFTDSVPHAALSGQYAVEQTLFVPVSTMFSPEIAPIRVLEKMAGCASASLRFI